MSGVEQNVNQFGKKPRRYKKTTAQTLQDLDNKISEMITQKEQLKRKRAEEIGMLVLNSGLADLNIPNDVLRQHFQELARRFRNSTT